MALKFAAMGYHAFVLKYSTYGIDLKKISNFREMMPVEKNSLFPNPMLDIAKAMLLIRERAEEWKVDTDKIVLCGFSAGAHNCAMYGVYWNQPVILDAIDTKAEQLKPAALILGYSPFDFVMHVKLLPTMSTDNQGLFEFFSLAYTGMLTPDEEMFRRISPYFHVSDHTPPTFLWSTANDELVPPQHTTAMANALAVNKIPFEMHIFEEGPHGLSLANQSSAEFDDDINPDVSEWVRLAERWLLKRFRLEVQRPREIS
ncbi:alpha/beta hydrolase [Paenibacillus peoriae]|uniref:alpha/beta hydrolase n=1 Tax=Paenibacillus peoriae TaxID=59893 RepID=UPI0030D621D7